MRSRLVRAVVVLCLAIVATACSKTLDTKGLEPTLGQKIDTLLSTTGVTVACPDGIKAKAGGTFECTATLPSGDTITVRVTQTDGDGHVAFSLVGASTPTPSP
jgi:hypothetical protein